MLTIKLYLQFLNDFRKSLPFVFALCMCMTGFGLFRVVVVGPSIDAFSLLGMWVAFTNAMAGLSWWRSQANLFEMKMQIMFVKALQNRMMMTQLDAEEQAEQRQTKDVSMTPETKQKLIDLWVEYATGKIDELVACRTTDRTFPIGELPTDEDLHDVTNEVSRLTRPEDTALYGQVYEYLTLRRDMVAKKRYQTES